MSPKMGTDHSSDDLDSSGSLKGKELKPWLQKLMSNRVLPLSSRSRINLTMPPIASQIWRRIAHFSPQAIRLPILRPASIPILAKPAILLSVWGRLLDLPLFRRRRKRRNEFLQVSDAITEEQFINNVNLRADEPLLNEYPQRRQPIGEGQLVNVPDEPHLSEHPQRVRTVGEGQLVNEADEVYPTVIKNLLSPPVVETKLSYTTVNPIHPTYPSLMPRWSKQMIDQPTTADVGGLAPLRVSSIRVPGVQQSGQIQRPSLRYIEPIEDMRAQVGRQPQPIYRSRWLDSIPSPPTEELSLRHIEHIEDTQAQASRRSQPAESSRWLDNVWSPITERLAISPVLNIKSSTIPRQSTRWTHPPPMTQHPYLITKAKAAEPSSRATQVPYMINTLGMVEVATANEEPVQSLGSYYPPVEGTVENGLPYFSPEQAVPTTYRAVLSSPDHSTKSRAIKSLDKPVLNLVSRSILNWAKNLKLPDIRAIPHRVLKVKQSGESVTPVKPLVETSVERARTIKTTEDSKNVPPSKGAITPTGLPVHETDVPTRFPISKTQTPLVQIETPSAAELRPQPSPVTVSSAQTPTFPLLKYLKSIGTPPLDSSEDNRIHWHQIEEPSSPPSKDIYRSSLELLLTSAVESRAVSNAIRREGLSPATFEGSAYHQSQPVTELALAPQRDHAEAVSPKLALAPEKSYAEAVSPELALAPQRSRAEAVSLAPARAEERAEEAIEEAATPDLDAIARDVYSILKRRLSRERERAFGLS